MTDDEWMALLRDIVMPEGDGTDTPFATYSYSATSSACVTGSETISLSRI